MTPEQAIAKALNIPAEGIVGWDITDDLNYLQINYDGECGISQTNIMVAIVDISEEAVKE